MAKGRTRAPRKARPKPTAEQVAQIKLWARRATKDSTDYNLEMLEQALLNAGLNISAYDINTGAVKGIIRFNATTVPSKTLTGHVISGVADVGDYIALPANSSAMRGPSGITLGQSFLTIEDA